VVDLVVLACVLTAMTKKGRQLLVLPPSPTYFLLEPPRDQLHKTDKHGSHSTYGNIGCLAPMMATTPSMGSETVADA